MKKITILQELIKNANNIVFFGGAGVSTESGIPDFRGEKGLSYESLELSPEQIISGSFFFSNPKAFYKFYKEKMIYLNAKPNSCHIGLKKLEDRQKQITIITQNIDGLHQMAGSSNVIELHGSVHKNYCLNCGKFYSIEKILKSEVPLCDCGGLIKPAVVLYEEALSQTNLDKSITAMKNADLLIVGGTSLVVYPAAFLINYYPKNRPLVIINKTLTGKEELASLVINKPIGLVFSKLDYISF